MKKQNLLLIVFLLLALTETQAQNLCCLKVNNKELSEEEAKQKYDDQMKAIVQEEIKRFTDYATSEMKYPELARDYCIEGEMIVRVVYNKGFESIDVIKSIDPLVDKMVLDKISKYINDFDRKYVEAPRLVFKIPIHFKMEG